MSTTIRPHFSHEAASTPSTPVPTASARPVSIFMRDSIDGTSDFFPFHDLAKLGGETSDRFSFQDLIKEGIDGSQDIDLFRTGCQVNGVSDCNIACSNTSYFFGSLETFYNCAALASIAYWTHEEGTYYVGPEAERNASVIMGDGTVASFDGRPVLQSFVKCAVESCDKDRLAKPCPDVVTELSLSSTTDEIFEAMDKFCPEIKAEINPDIFGPGVSRHCAIKFPDSILTMTILLGFNIICSASRLFRIPLSLPQRVQRMGPLLAEAARGEAEAACSTSDSDRVNDMERLISILSNKHSHCHNAC